MIRNHLSTWITLDVLEQALIRGIAETEMSAEQAAKAEAEAEAAAARASAEAAALQESIRVAARRDLEEFEIS